MNEREDNLATPFPNDPGSPILDGRTSTGPDPRGTAAGGSETQAPAIEPGTVLADRYRVERIIGRGGMGSVFEGRDLKLERTVAIKVLDLPGREAAERQESLQREAVLLARLQHPNIVAIHEIGQHGEVTFIVMDLVRGTPAEDVLSYVRAAVRAEGVRAPRGASVLGDAIGLPVPQGRPSLVAQGSWYAAVARVLLETVRTIEEAHHEGVVHRDIKPRNIMLRGDGTPVVLDFGLAGSDDHDVASAYKGLVGTVAYMAPEQVASGRTGNDPRSDVYQLGLLLYEFLTLRRAYAGDDPQLVLAAIQRGHFRMPRSYDRSIPRDLEAICLKAIELDPRRRYASASELRLDLERYVEGKQPPMASQGGPVTRGLRSARYSLRRRRLVAAAMLALALGTWGGAEAFSTEPVDVRFFRVRAGIESGAPEELAYYPDVMSVRKADLIGATVNTDTPKYIYAMSVFGELNPPTWMLPMPMQIVGGSGSTVEQSALQPDGWGVRIDAGETRVICTRIGEFSEAIPNEGLWLYVSDKPVPRIYEWMTKLQHLAAGSGQPGISYEMARALFDSAAGLTRGGAPDMSKAQQQQVSDLLTAESILADEWDLVDPKRYGMYMQVER